MNTDSDIIKRIRKGHINEYKIIIDQYGKKVESYVRARLFQKLDVDDIVQITFVKFYKALDRFDCSRPVLPYVLEIAKNELKMYYRSFKKTVLLDVVENIVYQKQEEGITMPESEELLGKLKGDQRTAIELFSKGFRYEEIAKQLKKPLNTVRTIIRRGREKLQSIYET